MLGPPLTFALSQDQTLQLKLLSILTSSLFLPRSVRPKSNRPRSAPTEVGTSGARCSWTPGLGILDFRIPSKASRRIRLTPISLKARFGTRALLRVFRFSFQGPTPLPEKRGRSSLVNVTRPVNSRLESIRETDSTAGGGLGHRLSTVKEPALARAFASGCPFRVVLQRARNLAWPGKLSRQFSKFRRTCLSCTTRVVSKPFRPGEARFLAPGGHRSKGSRRRAWWRGGLCHAWRIDGSNGAPLTHLWASDRA